MLLTAGSQPGMIGELSELDRRPEATVILTEGTPDLLALHSIIAAAGQTQNYILLTNSNGTDQNPFPWIAKRLANRNVIIIRDADEPGESGATKWTAALVESAATVRNPKLPYPITADHGPDLRDWLNEQISISRNDLSSVFPLFLAWLDSSPVISKAEALAAAASISLEEHEDDPHRLARLFLERHAWHREHGQTLRWWRSEWWRWTGRKYQKIPTEEIRAEITAAVKVEFDRCCQLAIEKYEAWKSSPVYSPDQDKGPPKPRKVVASLVTNTIGALQGMSVIPESTDQLTWIEDNKPTRQRSYIALKNGILDVDKLLSLVSGNITNQEECLIPHSPKWFSPVCLPYDFDPAADCPKWNAFIEHNLELDPERIKLLQEWAGYCLLPDTSQQKFVMLEGEGSNGKSVFCAALEAMLGSENVSHVPLDLFGQRFALTQTLGKLANIVADCGEIEKVAEGYLKQFTSGDGMFFDRKGIAGLEAVPTARMMIAVNNRPRFSDRSAGLWRRMILIPWRVQITEDQKIFGMDKTWFWEQTGELPGILRWALIGLHRLRQQKRFTQSALCMTALDDYRSESNPAREFLIENCDVNEFFSIITQDLYAAYKKWCVEHGYHPLGERTFGKEVMRVYPLVTKKRLREDGNRFYEYSGIGLKAEDSQQTFT